MGECKDTTRSTSQIYHPGSSLSYNQGIFVGTRSIFQYLPGLFILRDGIQGIITRSPFIRIPGYFIT